MTVVIFKPQNCFPPINRSIMFDLVELHPGANSNLSQSQLEKLLTHPDLDRYQKIGAIELVEALPEAVAPTEGVVDLGQYSVDKTDEVIGATHDLAVLEGWLSKEQRRTVRQQLNRRITAIKEGRE